MAGAGAGETPALPDVSELFKKISIVCRYVSREKTGLESRTLPDEPAGSPLLH